MKDNDLLDEIRELRRDIKELKKEFYLFKGKSLGLISILSVLASYLMDIIKKH